MLVPEVECRNAILGWFDSKVPRDETKILHNYDLPPGSSPLATSQSLYSISKSVPSLSGVISAHTTLRSIEITNEERARLTTMNSQIAVDGTVGGHESNFAGGGKGKKRKFSKDSKQSRSSQWSVFLSDCASRLSGVNVVVDGANVGYFKPRFLARKHLDWAQIDSMLRSLRSKGLTPAVILHQVSSPCPVPKQGGTVSSKLSSLCLFVAALQPGHVPP